MYFKKLVPCFPDKQVNLQQGCLKMSRVYEIAHSARHMVINELSVWKTWNVMVSGELCCLSHSASSPTQRLSATYWFLFIWIVYSVNCTSAFVILMFFFSEINLGRSHHLYWIHCPSGWWLDLLPLIWQNTEYWMTAECLCPQLEFLCWHWPWKLLISITLTQLDH
jgi:hypothetical protein